MEKINLVLPAHWEQILVDGDEIELSEVEERAIDLFIQHMDEHYGQVDVYEVSTKTYFTTAHTARIYKVPPCVCAVFSFVTVDEEAFLK